MREFKQYTNENGGTISVHKVTEETEGAVMTIDGSGRDVKAGDVLLGTPNSNVFIVTDDNALEGYSEDQDDDSDVEGGDVPDAERDDDFDPSENDAATVRRYLESAKARGDREEFNRVVALEQNDKDRKTALVDYDS